MEEIMLTNQQGQITFHAYQEMAGNCVRGTTEDRVKLMFRMLDRPVDKTIKSSEFETLVIKMIQTAGRIIVANKVNPESTDKPAELSPEFIKGAEELTHGLLHELLMRGEIPKTCLHKK